MGQGKEVYMPITLTKGKLKQDKKNQKFAIIYHHLDAFFSFPLYRYPNTLVRCGICGFLSSFLSLGCSPVFALFLFFFAFLIYTPS